jgi:hypothetical protein
MAAGTGSLGHEGVLTTFFSDELVSRGRVTRLPPQLIF